MEGIAAASSIQTDWWDELTDSVKEGYHEGMKDIEEENSRLKRIVANLTLENDAIKTVLEKKYGGLTTNGRR